MSKAWNAVLGISLMLSIAPRAHAGHEIQNGGDICEDRFKVVRDDIQSWIEQGGASNLVLPKRTSVAEYKTEMLAEIAQAQVSCVDSDIQVGGAEKTCENISGDKNPAQIVCNRRRFMETDESDQYVLVHHEYAGLSGLEENQGMSSQYSISNQITGALEAQAMMKLVINKRLDAGLEKDLPAIDAIRLIAPGTIYRGVDPKTNQPCQASLDSFGGLDVTIKSPESSKGVWFELRSDPDQVTTDLSGDLDHLELKVVAQYTTTDSAHKSSVENTYTLLLSGKDGAPSRVQVFVTAGSQQAEEASAVCEIRSSRILLKGGS